MKESKGVVIIAVILAFMIGLGYYTTTIMSMTGKSQAKTDNKEKSQGIKLGLDLSGGVAVPSSAILYTCPISPTP